MLPIKRNDMHDLLAPAMSCLSLLLGFFLMPGISCAAEPPFRVDEPKAAAERYGQSHLSRIWEPEEKPGHRPSVVTPYRGNYILPVTYNSSPNEGPARLSDPGKSMENLEVVFQISFKTRLWENVLDRNMDLWVAYTQRSFWQLYDFDDSSPFRETNYEPEFLLNFRTDYDLLGFRGRYVNVGVNHQSNGRPEPLSRSWNRAVANFGFERGDVVFVLNTWYRFPEDDADDDNPGIDRFMGYGQINLSYFRTGHRFGLSWRNNLRASGNKGAVQLEWSFPLLRLVDGYVHYFNGYGENLLDYNASSNRIGAGFILKEW
jgi:phospholipase A1